MYKNMFTKDEVFSELERVCEIYTEEIHGYYSNLSVDRYQGRMTNGVEWWFLVHHTPEDSGTAVWALTSDEVMARISPYWNDQQWLESKCDSYFLNEAKKHRNNPDRYMDVLRGLVVDDWLFNDSEMIVNLCFG